MGLGDEPQQAQVRTEQPLVLGELVEARGARVLVAVHRMAEPGHALAGRDHAPRPATRAMRRSVSSSSSHRRGRGRRRARNCAVSPVGPEEDAARTEEPGRDRALDRLGRAGVGEAGGERARRQAVIGERHEHGVEQAALARRSAPGGRGAGRPARSARAGP